RSNARVKKKELCIETEDEDDNDNDNENKFESEKENKQNLSISVPRIRLPPSAAVPKMRLTQGTPPISKKTQIAKKDKNKDLENQKVPRKNRFLDNTINKSLFKEKSNKNGNVELNDLSEQSNQRGDTDEDKNEANDD